MPAEFSRRPLKTREKNWPRQLAFRLVRLGLTPNQISLSSAVVSLIGAAALLFGLRQPLLFLLAAGCIQVRLLCNLLDGLMAVEGGLKTKAGEIFNEFPDRLADVALFVSAGYAIGAPEFGYLCAIVSVLTAYVRVFGGACGLAQDFCGPMAKQQRMFVLTLACIFAAAECWLHQPPRVLFIALVLVATGGLCTIIRRTLRIARLLNAR